MPDYTLRKALRGMSRLPVVALGVYLFLTAVLALWFGHSVETSLALAAVILAAIGLVRLGLRKWARS
jgi:hypothetical protein